MPLILPMQYRQTDRHIIVSASRRRLGYVILYRLNPTVGGERKITPVIYFYHGSSSASSYTVPHNYPSCLLFFKQTLPILFLLSESSPLPLTPRQPPPLFFSSSLSRFALSVPLGLVKSRRYTKAAGKESKSHFFSFISDEILCLLTIYSFPYQYYYDWLLFGAGRLQN